MVSSDASPNPTTHEPRTRVVHLSLGLSTGGLERLLVDFARFHDSSEYQLEFIAMGELGRPAAEIRDAGCVVHQLSQRAGRWAKFRELSTLFRELRPDVVHTHNAYPHWHGTLAARWAGVPVVVNTRHGQRHRQTLRARLQFWIASLATNSIVAVSDDAAMLCLRDDCISSKRVRRIWNGIDIDRFEYRGSSHAPVAISVARLAAEKDFPTLLKAVHLAAKLVPELRLRLVGNGSERATLESLATELGIDDRVEFLGERNDVPELLAESGFFVSSSLTEGISLTLLEAMAVGLPVLATAVGGNPEIIQEGLTGHLVSPQNADELAAGIVRMCQSKSRWREMGERGRERVREVFNVHQMVANYERLYAELLAQKRPRSQRTLAEQATDTLLAANSSASSA